MCHGTKGRGAMRIQRIEILPLTRLVHHVLCHTQMKQFSKLEERILQCMEQVSTQMNSAEHGEVHFFSFDQDGRTHLTAAQQSTAPFECKSC